MARELAKRLEPFAPVRRFPDSLQLSQEHFINTKPRGELPPLPPLGVHPDQPEALPDDEHLRGLIRKLGGPK